MDKKVLYFQKEFVLGFLLSTFLVLGVLQYALPYMYGTLVVRAKAKNNYVSITKPNGVTTKIWTYKKPEDVTSVLRYQRRYFATTPDGRQVPMIPAKKSDIPHLTKP